MNWQEILPKAKAEREKLQKQLDKIRGKLYRLDKAIFKAEVAIKRMNERKEKIQEDG